MAQVEKSKDLPRFTRKAGENWRSSDTISCKVRVLKVNSAPDNIAQEVVVTDLRVYLHPATTYIYTLSPVFQHVDLGDSQQQAMAAGSCKLSVNSHRDIVKTSAEALHPRQKQYIISKGNMLHGKESTEEVML